MGTLMDSWPKRHRVTAEEYHRMAELGLLAPDARVELIEGEIIEMAPIGREHISVVDQLTELLVRAVGNAAIVRVQGSVRLGSMSEPEPDLVLLRRRADFYRNEFAGAQDVLLVIDVSDTTLRYDREVKVPLYARHGVPETWIVDLPHQRLLVYGEPNEGGYQPESVLERPALVPVAGVSGLVVDLSAVFRLI